MRTSLKHAFQFCIQGFESRGTALAQRLTAWKNLLEATEPSGLLTTNPFAYQAYNQNVVRKNTTKVSVIFRFHSTVILLL